MKIKVFYMKKFIITIALCLSIVPQLMAQNVFHGEIVSKKEGIGIANGYVLIIQDGKVFKTTSSDKKGLFSMNVPNGNYIV